MELKEFVATTLKQIIEGVSEAQLGMTDRGLVNPRIMGDVQATRIPLAMGGGRTAIRFIEFDVAVSTSAIFQVSIREFRDRWIVFDRALDQLFPPYRDSSASNRDSRERMA